MKIYDRSLLVAKKEIVECEKNKTKNKKRIAKLKKRITWMEWVNKLYEKT